MASDEAEVHSPGLVQPPSVPATVEKEAPPKADTEPAPWHRTCIRGTIDFASEDPKLAFILLLCFAFLFFLILDYSVIHIVIKP